MKKTIGIIGGMGPLATCKLMQKIIDKTDAGTDQQHIRICVDSNTNIKDRTAFILGHGEDPLPQMVKSGILLQAMGADLIIMPCNTAHYFYDRLVTFLEVPVINMLKTTAASLKQKGIKRVGLLATEGTVKSKIYNKFLSDQEIDVIIPDTTGQNYITSIIYEGVKASNKNIDISGFLTTIHDIIDKGAETLILGCTELPLAFEWFNIDLPNIDPMDVLALQAIVQAGYKPIPGIM